MAMNNEKIIEKRLLQMQREILLKLPGAGTECKSDCFCRNSTSEQNIDLDDLTALFALDPDSRRQLNLINHALNRLHRKEYYRCVQCGSQLSGKYLKEDPLTDLCETCLKKQNDDPVH